MMRKLNHGEIADKRFSAEQLQEATRSPIYSLIDNVRSLYNVGSIFRTSDAARIQGLILTGYTPHPPRKEIEKTALGATRTVPWKYTKDAVEALAELRAAGVRLCVVEQTDKSVPYFSLTDQHFPLCLIVGNEISGVSKEVVAMADIGIEIPMFGMKQSLNVAVAYGIALFECVRIIHRRELI